MAAPISRSVPINAAEAIFEPFWDPQTSGLSEWQTVEGKGHGLVVRQDWAWVVAEWARRPASGPAFSLSRDLDLDCTRYDRLMVCANPGKGNRMRLEAETDAGRRVADLTGYLDERKEYFLDLGGAKRITRVSIEVFPKGDGAGAAWVQWLGLQSTVRLPDVTAQYSGYDPAWPKHLKPETDRPRFEPSLGIALDASDLAGLRKADARLRASGRPTLFEQAAEHARKRAPETMIGPFCTYMNSRMARDRDMNTWLLQTGVNAAIAGLVFRDQDLLRLGARYALSIAACPTWDDGFVCTYPLSAWEQRPFLQALAAHDVAIILDLAGEVLTEAGAELLRRRLGEHALGALNYAYWKHEYIYGCNQAAWFSPARFLAYGVLEKRWPRVRPYLELARNDLIENIDRIVLSDGGCSEGPMYFRPVGRDAALAFYYLSRLRGEPFLDALPDRVRLAADFGELVMTTTDEGDFIPYADSYTREFEGFAKAAMAGAMPHSAWAEMLARTWKRKGSDPVLWPLDQPFHPNYQTSLSDVVIAWKLAQGIRPGEFRPRPFLYLPELGLMTSHRRMGEHPVKLLILGNRANAGHNDEDKGSFILEFAGQTFACDPILATSYGDPAILIGKQASSHNLLLPVGTPGRPAQLNPLPADAKPTGRGDERRFRATIDLTPGWPGFYKRWVRTWESPTPDRLTIRDDYELAQGTGVEFVWYTEREVKRDGGRVRLTGERGQVILDPPDGWESRVEPVLNGKYHRIAFTRQGLTGSLTLTVRLESR